MELLKITRQIRYFRGTLQNDMKIRKIKPVYVGMMIVAVLTASCEYGRQAEEQLNEFNSQAEELEVLINEGIDKVNSLDSILPKTNERLKQADSIVKDASSNLDSLKQKVNEIQNIFN